MRGLPSLCGRTFLAAMLLSMAQAARAGDACSLRVPGPVLRPGAYPAQTLARQGDHVTRESARLRPGLRIEIRQDACEDAVTTRFTLLAVRRVRGRATERSDDEWIDLARAEIGKLKTSGPPHRFAELERFLGKARRLAPRGGERTLCRDGSAPAGGDCSWESLGGYSISVRRGHGTTAVQVTETISA